jgi:hypothetical protein
MFIRSLILGASLCFVACDDTASPAPMPPAPVASVAPAWQQQAGSLVAAARMSPLAAGRVYAALSVAQQRAAAAAKANPLATAPHDAVLGAVAGASVQVLSFLFPAATDSLEAKLAARLAATSGDARTEFTRGVSLGRTAGTELVDRLKNDGFTKPWTGTAQSGAGIWVPVSMPPAGILLGSVTPYFLTSGSQFRPAPPPAFGSAAFNTDLNEVFDLTKNRTQAQLDLAKSWDYSAGTTTPVGYWNKVATDYIAAKALDEVQATRVLGLMHAAVFDAQIACWDAKYHYWTIRPYQANTQVAMALSAPNHPSYPSGHSCVSASAARILAEFFPDRAADLNELVTSAGMSRVYAGIHYRFDITAGQKLGVDVAQWTLAKGAM